MKSNAKSSDPYFTSNEALLYCEGPLWVEFYLFHNYSGIYLGNLGKLDPNTPNHVQGPTKSNTKSSAPQLTSNKVLLLCQGDLGVVIRALWVFEHLGNLEK